MMTATLPDEGRTSKVRVGLDTFADITVSSLEVARKLGARVEKYRGPALVDVSRRVLPVGGCYWVELQWQGKAPVRVKVVVLAPFVEPVDMLLSNEDQQKFGSEMRWNMKTNEVVFVGGIKSDEMNSDEMKCDEMNSDEMSSDEMKCDERKCDEMNSDEMNSDGMKCDEKFVEGAEEVIIDEDFVAIRKGARWCVNPRLKPTAANVPLVSKPVFYDKRFLTEHEEVMDAELAEWLQEGVIVEALTEELKAVKNYLPVNCIFTPLKNTKVRVTFDFARALNKMVECHASEKFNERCIEEIRKWRCAMGIQSTVGWSLVDCRKAYLSIELSKTFQQFCYFSFKSRAYRLQRLPFGLSSAPKILAAVLRKVLQGFLVKNQVYVYRDDLLMRDEQVNEVQSVLAANGFASRVESLGGQELSSVVLGHRLCVKQEQVWWQRRESLVLPSLKRMEEMTVREVSEFVGKVVPCHLLRLGWLRPICQLMRSLFGKENEWDVPASESVKKLLKQLVNGLQVEDPAKGVWAVPTTGKFELYTDASSWCIGCVLLVDGQPIEDQAELITEKKVLQINYHELEGIIKGLKLFLKWRGSSTALDEVMLYTDSKSCRAWIEQVINDRVIRITGLMNVLIQRRLEIIRLIILEYGLKVRVTFVKSHQNLADPLTRVPKKYELGKVVNWIGRVGEEEESLKSEPLKFRKTAQLLGENEPIDRVVTVLHREAGHSGIKVLFELLREKVGGSHRENLLEACQRVCRECEVCRLKNRSRHPPALQDGGVSFDSHVLPGVIK